MSYFTDLASSNVFLRPSSPPPLVPVNSESDRESVIRLRGTNKSARFRPYTRLQRRETEITVFDVEKRWQEHDNVISRLKKHQIGKSPEQLAEELERHRLQMADVRRRKSEKLSRELENKQRQTKIQGMRTTLRQMEQVVNKQQSMMDCSRAILQRQVELLQFTIAEVKRQSALSREIDEEMKNILGQINILQQQKKIRQEFTFILFVPISSFSFIHASLVLNM